MPPVNGLFSLAPKETNLKRELPKVVKKFADSEGNNLILIKEVFDSNNACYKEGCSRNILTLYKENKIAEGLSSYQKLETKEVYHSPKGIMSIKKNVFDDFGNKEAEYSYYRDENFMTAESPLLDITIKDDWNGKEITRLNKKSDDIQIKELRPEIRRIFKLIAESFKKAE